MWYLSAKLQHLLPKWCFHRGQRVGRSHRVMGHLCMATGQDSRLPLQGPQQRNSNKPETQLSFGKFAFHFSSVRVTGANERLQYFLSSWQIIRQLNLVSAQFHNQSQTKANQTELRFLKFIDPVCLFHLSRLLLFHVLNQRREHESFVFGLVWVFCSLKESIL